jgi:PAS domain S-box-containing protein
MSFDEADIHRALDEEEYYPFFQPLVELRTGQLAGFELLARWIHPRLGTISPDNFIPVLETSGRINELTIQLLKKALTSSSVFTKSLRLAVNLAPHQLLDTTLPAKIVATAALYGFSLDCLTIEITESALLFDLPRSQTVARDLISLGCHLALDDFGTGHSSLKHLQALPFDEIKVDRSFVGTMTTNRDSRKIVAGVVGLGQSLGLLTVAEGVETVEEARILLWLGCDLGQGWLYGKPAAVEEIPRMISAAPQIYSPYMPAPTEGSSVMSLETLPAQRLAQLQAVYDGAPVGLCFLDRNLRYISLNRHLAEMNGKPITEHLGKTPAEMVPAIFPSIEPFIRRALRGEPVTGVEIHRPPANAGGDDRTLLASYQPARDEAGEILGVSIAIVDITARKRAEEALSEIEEHHSSMIKHNPHILWVLDDRGKVIEASPRWETVTGLTHEQTIGDGWMQALHPDDVAPTIRAIEELYRTGQDIDIEYRVHKPDGEWRLMRSHGSPSFGSSGEVFRVYGSVDDIEYPKRTEKALLNTQAQLQSVLESIPVGVIIADSPEGNVVSVNPVAKQIFGDAIKPGQTLADYGKWGALRANGEHLKQEDYPLSCAIIHGESTVTENVFFMRGAGKRTKVKLSGKPIRENDGQISGGVMFIEELKSTKLNS